MKTLQLVAMTLMMAFASQPVAGKDKGFEVAALLKGASIIAQDDKKTPLGMIDNELFKESIFNELSKAGNKYMADSIFNEFGRFGSETGEFSAFNENSKKPPMIVKDGKVIGYLTANKTIRGGISVPALLALKSQF